MVELFYGNNRENDLVSYTSCFRIMEAQYLMFQFYVGREDSVGMQDGAPNTVNCINTHNGGAWLIKLKGTI
jgi:hypothetical protein